MVNVKTINIIDGYRVDGFYMYYVGEDNHQYKIELLKTADGYEFTYSGNFSVSKPTKEFVESYEKAYTRKIGEYFYTFGDILKGLI